MTLTPVHYALGAAGLLALYYASRKPKAVASTTDGTSGGGTSGGSASCPPGQVVTGQFHPDGTPICMPLLGGTPVPPKPQPGVGIGGGGIFAGANALAWTPVTSAKVLAVAKALYDALPNKSLPNPPQQLFDLTRATVLSVWPNQPWPLTLADLELVPGMGVAKWVYVLGPVGQTLATLWQYSTDAAKIAYGIDPSAL